MPPQGRELPTVWLVVEPGSYIARRGGRQVGAVVNTGSGQHVALDAESAAIGSFPSLLAAQQSVVRHDRGVVLDDSPPRRPVELFVGLMAGVVIAAVAVLAAIWFSIEL